MKTLLLLLCLTLSVSAVARDLSERFTELYETRKAFSARDLAYLGDKEIVFVPGILSESLTWADRAAPWDFSLLTSDYFSAQVASLRNLGLRVEKILPSSYSVAITIGKIRKSLERVRAQGRRAVFITHSLGGLALLDQLIAASSEDTAVVAGILFLQSPFYGSPVADVYQSNPYSVEAWLRPILPFVNTSPETISYLSKKNRIQTMDRNHSRIQDLLREIPAITIAGTANGSHSVFQPAVDLMEFGCIRHLFKGCASRVLHPGPYDQSDGMVPFESSKLPGTDFVRLDGVDHGEMVVNLPFTQYAKARIPVVLLKLLVEKVQR